jgi:hypothetical protein
MSARPVVVVASPDQLENARLCDWLHAEGFEPLPASSLQAARQAVHSGTYDVLIADAAFAFDHDLQTLARKRNARAPLVVVGGAAAAQARAQRQRVFHVDRPVDHDLLLCHVAMAIAEGRPTRRSPRKCIAPFEAVVEGANAYIIDVSNEGLRLALPRGRSAPPPYFAIRVPLIGVTLTVRRVWTSAAPVDSAAAAWCGAELHQPPPRAEHSWRLFVSAVSGPAAVD